MSRLTLDRDKVELCRQVAAKIAKNTRDFISHHTSPSIERATLRLLGVEETYQGRPVADLVVEALPPKGLSLGICHWLARGIASQHSTLIGLCLRIAEGRVRFEDFPEISSEESQRVFEPMVRSAIGRLERAREERVDRLHRFRDFPRPFKYSRIPLGTMDEEIATAKDLIENQGVACLEVENPAGIDEIHKKLRGLRQATFESSDKVERYIRLTADSSGNLMPEIAVAAAVERVDYLLNDLLYGRAFQKVHSKRLLVDQHVARLIAARSGMVLFIGDNAYAETAQSFRVHGQNLAALFLNEQFALQSYFSSEKIGVAHGFEIDPEAEDNFLLEIARAQLFRETFPKAPIKYLYPFRSPSAKLDPLLNALFHMVGLITRQDVHVLQKGDTNGMDSFQYLFRAVRGFSDEVDWSTNGKIMRHARSILEDAAKLMHRVEQVGLVKGVEQDLFKNVAWVAEAEEPAQEVVRKATGYWNPLLQVLEKQLEEEVTAPLPMRREPRRERPEERERGGESGERRSQEVAPFPQGPARRPHHDRGRRPSRPPRHRLGPGGHGRRDRRDYRGGRGPQQREASQIATPSKVSAPTPPPEVKPEERPKKKRSLLGWLKGEKEGA